MSEPLFPPPWDWTNHTLLVFAISTAVGAQAAVERLKDDVKGRAASFSSVIATITSLGCAAWFCWTVLA